MELILITGPAASGKTIIARALRRKIRNSFYILIQTGSYKENLKHFIKIEKPSCLIFEEPMGDKCIIKKYKKIVKYLKKNYNITRIKTITIEDEYRNKKKKEVTE